MKQAILSPKLQISAYIPCYNNAATIARVIRSIQEQTWPVRDFFIIDDGSTDDSAAIARGLGVRVISHPQNLGRGAARARAMVEAKYEFVLCCDGTKIIDPNFVENALPWFQEERVAAIFGSLIQPTPQTVADRWRGRHIFQYFSSYSTFRSSCFASFGAIVRKSSVLKAGNYNNLLRHNEDGELGQRLLSLGYNIISDGNLLVTEISSETVAQILQRDWRWKRWNGGKGHKLSWKTYWQWIIDSITHGAIEDFQSGDLMSIPISLFSPHYRFWRSWWAKDRFLIH